MRALILIGLAGAAACSGDTGLALTISAPDGPARVSRLEIVLASPAFEVVDDQLTGGNVRYYRQKSTAGEIKDPPVFDGYVVRIEGRGEGKLVPFVIAYDARPQPIAAGTVLDASQLLPLPLEVPGSSRIEATVTMTQLAPAELSLGVMSGQIAEVPCAPASNAAPWRSGIAWQPPAELQLRLLLPDPASGSVDATGRSLDLDCDGYPANGGDCDDVRTRFNPGAPEACDGVDTNCNGSHFAITSCPATDARCGADGVNYCQDLRGAPELGQCLGSPQCLCTLGACSRCVLGFVGAASPFKPCAAGLGMVPLPVGCDPLKPCVVEVAKVDGPWEAGLAASAQAEFGQSATVAASAVFLRVDTEKSSLGTMPGASVGAVHLVITGDGLLGPRYLGLDLELGKQLSDCSAIATPGGDNYGMMCTVP